MDDFEIEIKAPIKNAQQVISRLESLGAIQGATVHQSDEYFAHPARDFHLTDEALRIRGVAEHYWVTYKGPRLESATKTRVELEYPLAWGTRDDCRNCFLKLGFTPVAIVNKTRALWSLLFQDTEFEVALDTVEDLGTYIELEVKSRSIEVSTAQQSVEQLAQTLELEPTISASYLELLLAQKRDDT